MDELRTGFRTIHKLLADLQQRLDGLETVTQNTAKQVGFLPAQIRMLTGKVDGLTTSISEPRLRSVLLSVLGVYDLVDQLLRAEIASPTDARSADLRHHEVVRTQLRQILEANGLSEIDTKGPFDPTLHCAIEQAPCSDPSLANSVLDVLRAGFRTEHAVLRHAAVRIAKYTAPNSAERQLENETLSEQDRTS
jgi:molecular chaperone GrpE (heat shock protein)